MAMLFMASICIHIDIENMDLWVQLGTAQYRSGWQNNQVWKLVVNIDLLVQPCPRFAFQTWNLCNAESSLEECVCRTNSWDVQRAIEESTEKRTKDTYGPPVGKKLIIFLDDLNMPRVDVYGTQQPIALLKLFIEKQGVYDRGKELNWKNMKDIQVSACCHVTSVSANSNFFWLPKYQGNYNLGPNKPSLLLAILSNTFCLRIFKYVSSRLICCSTARHWFRASCTFFIFRWFNNQLIPKTCAFVACLCQ